MGLFGIFGKDRGKTKDKAAEIQWNQLNRLEQLDEIDEISKTTPVLIFKHSSRCGISSMVLRQFERSFDLPDKSMNLYFLDLLNYREVSNEVAARYQVIHQSPQLIVIRNGNTIYHSSHHEIRADELSRFS